MNEQLKQFGSATARLVGECELDKAEPNIHRPAVQNNYDVHSEIDSQQAQHERGKWCRRRG